MHLQYEPMNIYPDDLYDKHDSDYLDHPDRMNGNDMAMIDIFHDIHQLIGHFDRQNQPFSIIFLQLDENRTIFSVLNRWKNIEKKLMEKTENKNCHQQKKKKQFII